MQVIKVIVNKVPDSCSECCFTKSCDKWKYLSDLDYYRTRHNTCFLREQKKLTNINSSDKK